MNKKILVITFPGFGYLADRPLFYYAKKLARQYDFDVLDIEYQASPERDLQKNGIHEKEKNLNGNTNGIEDIREKAKKLLPVAIDAAAGQIETALRERTYTDLICISKSFGTLVAGSLWEQLEAKAAVSQIFLTPLPETFPLMQGKRCTAASGTADPFMTKECMEAMQTDGQVVFYRFENANHSLENPADTGESVRNLARVVSCYGAVFEQCLNLKDA